MNYDEKQIAGIIEDYYSDGQTTQDDMISGNEDAFYDSQDGGYYLFGSDLIEIEHVDTVTINNKVYSHAEKVIGFIPYELLTDKTKQLYAIYLYEGVFRSKKLDGWKLQYKNFSFAPFDSIKAQICNKKTYPVDAGSMVYGKTSNVIANLYIEFADVLGCDLKRGNTMKVAEVEKDDYVFRHCVFSYGYGNYLYVEYKAEDLINMDVSILDKEDVERLKNECELEPIINNSINPAVFKRPLTDSEKVECAEYFLKNMARTRDGKEMKQLKVK